MQEGADQTQPEFLSGKCNNLTLYVCIRDDSFTFGFANVRLMKRGCDDDGNVCEVVVEPSFDIRLTLSLDDGSVWIEDELRSAPKGRPLAVHIF